MQQQINSVSSYIKVGVIVGAHGIRGAIKIKSFTTKPWDINKYGRLYNSDQSTIFDIKITAIIKTNLLVRIKGVDDRTAADTMIGTKLYIKKENLPTTNENEYYYCDLVGMYVINQNGQAYGYVVSVQNFGAGDILEIQQINSNKRVMHSFKNEIFPQVDLISRIITIKIS